MAMRLIGKRKNDRGQTILTVEESFFVFWKRQREFIHLNSASTFSWAEFPGMKPAGDVLSLHLKNWTL